MMMKKKKKKKKKKKMMNRHPPIRCYDSLQTKEHTLTSYFR